ncbi:SDR family oxidoreductase [Phenylobacterium sp.]|jgi:2-keto-3-deoxy-L-fuconate dehydrogenase|uniref:SDR family oxidoreductase n=1 Tax=Phenylobacterium sp. TaxID=1871053 RepID=UPI0037C8B848
MSARLAGKLALVTAAAAGIGRAIALTFAAEGAEVLATDIDEAGLAALGPTLRTRVLDVTDATAVAALFAAEPAFDILVNAAGRVDGGTILEVSDRVWDLAFDLNVRSMHRMTAAALPGMLAKGAGSIVNIGSVASSLKGVTNRYVYSATKAAVIGMTKAVAMDFVGQGIRCNVICPGTVDTPSLGGRIASAADPEAARRDFVARQPMGRFGTAQEIANLALYLASDEATFTSGAVHVIDGAWSA